MNKFIKHMQKINILIIIGILVINGKLREEDIINIKKSIKKNILYYYYWHKMMYGKEREEELYPYDKKIPIKIIKERGRFYVLIDYKLKEKGSLYKEPKEWRYVYIGEIKKIKGIKVNEIEIYYYKDYEELFRGKIDKGEVYKSTIKLSSKWEPEYGEVKGKKKEMVEAIKKFLKKYFLEFSVENLEDLKRLKNKKIIIYIRNFYIWEEETMVLVISKIMSYYAYINIEQNNQYDIWRDIKPLNWEVNKDFRLEGYRGRDEYLRKFAKHYIREEIEIRKEDIERWERRNEKR